MKFALFLLENASAEPPAAGRSSPLDPKAISPFALPGVKKRRLFEDKPARSSCALGRQGKRAADGPGLDRPVAGGGIVPFSLFVVTVRSWQLYERIGEPDILSNFVVGEPGSQILIRLWRL